MERATVERLRNQWIAVGDDGTVVAHDLSFEKLDELLSTMPPIRVLIRRVPAVDEPLFVGSW